MMSWFRREGCPIADTMRIWSTSLAGGARILNMTLPDIQRAIEALPQEEQAQLATWVADRDLAAWDAEIERDFTADGAGAALLDSVRQQVREGKSKPLSQGPRHL
jgi:hypothetical protein